MAAALNTRPPVGNFGWERGWLYNAKARCTGGTMPSDELGAPKTRRWTPRGSERTATLYDDTAGALGYTSRSAIFIRSLKR
jgi:hypothetical protein